MKVAIIHDWLIPYGGAERVLLQMTKCFPDADIYTLVDFLPEEKRSFLANRIVNTSFIQKLPYAKKYFQKYLFLFGPLAIEQFDLSHYDIIISSSWAFAKGILVKADQFHVSYIHTPIRFASSFQFQYLKSNNLEKGLKSWLTRYILHKLRIWDYRTAASVDLMFANSSYIKKRINKTYRRESIVLYPPVSVDNFEYCIEKGDYYLAASRLVYYKRFDLIIEAFNQMPNKKLVLIGDGVEYAKLKKLANSNIELMGYQSDEVLKKFMQRAKAFVFAGEEDFGIILVEAQACGTPVIAYGKGGTIDTISPIGGDVEPTGIFFKEQTKEAIINAVTYFEKNRNIIDPKSCRKKAELFSSTKFRERFVSLVKKGYNEFVNS